MGKRVGKAGAGTARGSQTDPSHVARFMADVRIVAGQGGVAGRPDLGPCWMWTGPVNADGYGVFTVHGKHKAAHRYAYALFVGSPAFRVLLHSCAPRLCVSPLHVEAVAGASARPRRRGAPAAAGVVRRRRERRTRLGQVKPRVQGFLTVCPAGHEWDPDDQDYDTTGRRICWTCEAGT